MRTELIESLECRRLFSSAPIVPGPATPVPNAQSLSADNVRTILAQAISQGGTRTMSNTEVAVVVDREGTVLGMLASSGAVAAGIAPQALFEATVRARTAAFFESNGEAFTTRTARFIVQTHFPPGVANAGGGPLYGVEFSSLVNTDILLPSQTPAVSGDPGGIPLYIKGANGKSVAVGGIGVAGDFHDVAAIQQLLGFTQDQVNSLDNGLYNANPKSHVYHGNEETDRDEAVALAGAQGFMAPASIRANKIFVGGLRLPFTSESAARGKPVRTFQQLVEGGGAAEYTSGTSGPVRATVTAIAAGTPELQNFSFANTAGLIRDRANVVMSDTPGVPVTGSNGQPIAHTDPQNSDSIISATPAPDGNYLTVDDVSTIISQAVQQADVTRAGIRKPNGVNAEVHVVVVDTAGQVLGAFRMNDGTNFSYDVAVQKARTAAFFSDNSHAFSTRAIGFMSQQDFPPGITSAQGPLYLLQNSLSPQLALVSGLSSTPYQGLANGITIFPGGVPLYKNGVLVGAVGVSGDGVDQDDLVAYSGAKGYEAPAAIRSDSLSASDISSFILGRLAALEQMAGLSGFDNQRAQKALNAVLPHTRLPYVKFPRNPGTNGK